MGLCVYAFMRLCVYGEMGGWGDGGMGEFSDKINKQIIFFCLFV